jgi:anthranilate/para-aminobenzoate synthase component I
MFPGGSITGAPKIRAMEIIEELEPTTRGVYTGAIGFLGIDGTVCLNIAIRTIIIADGRAWVHTGGGIVADSDPQAEWDETATKARALLAGIQAVQRRQSMCGFSPAAGGRQ